MTENRSCAHVNIGQMVNGDSKCLDCGEMTWSATQLTSTGSKTIRPVVVYREALEEIKALIGTVPGDKLSGTHAAEAWMIAAKALRVVDQR